MNKSAITSVFDKINAALKEAEIDGLQWKMRQDRELVSQSPIPDENGKLWARQRPGPTITLYITITDPSVPKKGEHPEDV